MFVLAVMISICTAETPPPVPKPLPIDKILYPGRTLYLIGPYGGIDYNIHTGKFATTQDELVCCNFEDGTGVGPVAGFKAFLSPYRTWTISPRLLYENYTGTFSADPETLPIFGENNMVEDWTFQDDLEISLGALSVELLYVQKIVDMNLYVAAGPSVNYIITNNFRKTEHIIDPPGVAYLDGSTSKLLLDDKLDIITPLLLTLRGGLGGVIPIGKNFYLNPEVLYGFPLTIVSDNGEWRVTTIQATLGVLYQL